MAEINSNIYSHIQAPDYIGAAANGLKLRDMVRQQQIADRAQNFQNTLKGAYTQDPATGQLSFDNSKLRDLANIDPEKAYAMQVQMRQQALEQQKANIELQHVKLGDMARILGGASDQDSYDAAVKEATDKGYLHAGEAPATFDPKWVKGYQTRALSYQDQLAEQHKGTEEGFKKQEADAKTSEANTAAAKLPIEQGELGVKKQQAANEGKKLDIELGKRDYEQAKDLGAHLDKGWSARSGAAGAVQTKLNAADAAQGLIDQGKGQKGGLDSRQVAELAQLTASLLGGGQLSDSRVNELLPETAKSKGIGYLEYLKNAPQGAELQAFTDRLGETVRRERGIAEAQKKQFQIEGLTDFADLKRRNEKQYNSQLRSRGIDPSQIDAAGRYKGPHPVDDLSDEQVISAYKAMKGIQ